MKRTIRLGELLLRCAEAALPLQSADGSFPPGWNGPYRDPETPARNTAHHLILLLHAWELSGEPRWRQAAEAALAFLLAAELRPMQASFWCRRNPAKDFCNGLVGQAWVLEALLAATDRLADPRPLQLASAVFHAHAFDPQVAAWHSLHVDGHLGPIDPTLNHQLWFAVQAAELARRGDAEARARLEHFLQRLPSRLLLYPSGLIRHENPFWQGSSPGAALLGVIKLAKALPTEPRLQAKSLGYHAFNTVALARLLPAMTPEQRSAPSLRRIFALLRSQRFRRAVATAPYGYEYNPPGLEVPLSLRLAAMAGLVEPPEPAYQQQWIQSQLDWGLDSCRWRLDRRSPDPPTAAARLYEAVSLDPQLELLVS